MTNFKKQIVSAAAVGAMFLNLATPVLAGTEIVISGNGAGSDNWATVNQNNTTTVNQNNNANVTNTVNADADSGNNDANFNTGGNVGIGTGNAKVFTDINNDLNKNHAEVDCCAAGNTKVDISGNSAKSDNGIDLRNKTNTTVDQDNRADVDNTVNADADTGDNDANSNTGGNVEIGTGNAVVDTDILTTANANSARVGNGSHGGDNPSATFLISGNGAGSDNYITARLTNVTDLTQDNYADVDNDVDAEAETGENDANFNTGGDVFMNTGYPSGGALVDTTIDNSVNFNYADVDCGCTWDVTAKIKGNGASDGGDYWKWWEKDENLITLNLNNSQLVDQGNRAYLDNMLDDLRADTGDNDANSNTGYVDGYSDPSIGTGNAVVDTDVSNSGGLNFLGDMNFEMPELPEVNATFDMSFFMALLGINVSH